MSWLGRGYENVPGKSFGWAFHEERREIRDHLKRRGRWVPGYGEFEVTRIQQRIHRHKPTYAERQAIARARGERWVSPPPGPPPVIFTGEELQHIAEHYAFANDPIGQAICAKAIRA